jgi:hypothetical protein
MLHSFDGTDGSEPYTYSGGAIGGYGTVFEITCGPQKFHPAVFNAM